MRCPKCGSPYSLTISVNKNNSEFKDKIFRSRRCDECYHIFNTVETFCSEPMNDMVITQIENDRNLAARKHKAIKIAMDFNYGQLIVDRIQEATSEEQINRILKSARNRI